MSREKLPCFSREHQLNSLASSAEIFSLIATSAELRGFTELHAIKLSRCKPNRNNIVDWQCRGWLRGNLTLAHIHVSVSVCLCIGPVLSDFSRSLSRDTIYVRAICHSFYEAKGGQSFSKNGIVSCYFAGFLANFGR